MMIRTQDYKYVYRAGARCEFYDLREDPKEQQNRVDWPEYAPLIVQMKERILAWYQNTCDIVPFQTNERFSRRMIWERVKLLCPQGYEDEVKEKIAQGMGLFQAQYYCRDLAKGKSHQ